MNPVGLAEVVALARAVDDLPGQQAWWDSVAGRDRRKELLTEQWGNAVIFVGELLSTPAPDNWDPNWPAYKLFRFVPEGARVGDRVQLGNGEGLRAEGVITVQNGEIGLVIDETSVRDPLRASFRWAYDRIVGLLEDGHRPER